MKNTTVGIIGFGRFGQLLARLLKEDFDVFVSNRSDKSLGARKLGVKYASLSEAAAKDLVIFCVPISEIKKAVTEIKPYLKKGALVIDTCSVKEYPIRVMKSHLPQDIDVLGTHPLFGPDSFAKKAPRKWVFCPDGKLTGKMQKWKSFIARKGFEVIVADPAAHDRNMVFAINLPHLIGIALSRSNFSYQKISTASSGMLHEFRRVALNDSGQLFKDIHRYNRFARKAEERFLLLMKKILREIYGKQ